MTTTITPPAQVVPAWMTWVPRVAPVWAVGYGAVRVWFATGHEPGWKLPTDLLIPAWVSALLCLVSLAVVLGMRARPRDRRLLAIAWATAVGWVAACALVLLDVVGGALPGLGIPFDLAGMLSRLGALALAALVAGTALAHQRDSTRAACGAAGPGPGSTYG